MRATGRCASRTKLAPRVKAFLERLWWGRQPNPLAEELVVQLEPGDWERLPDELRERILLNSSRALGTTPTEQAPDDGVEVLHNPSRMRVETSTHQRRVRVTVWKTPGSEHPSLRGIGEILLEMFVAGPCVCEPPNDPSSATGGKRPPDSAGGDQ